jgi:hypothetical protein
MNIEDEHIWTLVKNLADKCKRDLIDIDDEYKQQLIKGYKICKGKLIISSQLKKKNNIL